LLRPYAGPPPPRGSAGWEVELPGGAKAFLDRVRAAVWPTLPGHHQLKIVAAEAVERAERELAAGRRPAELLAGDLRRRYLTAALEPGREVQVVHVKPDGREPRLPGRVESLRGGRLLLSRRFRPGGSYDSLDRPKLAGDVGEVEQVEGSWVSRRRYLRASGAPIGELYNIQTPTELYPSGVRYLDLEVDVAAWPDGRVEVVDQAELGEAVQSGYLTPRLGRRALEVAEQVAALLRRGEPVVLERWRGSLE
jgi:hypothetical protein